MAMFKKFFIIIQTIALAFICCTIHKPTCATLLNEELNTELVRSFSPYFFNKTRKMSSSQISELSSILSSTQDDAPNKALTYLNNISTSQPNPVSAFFTICTALTTPDGAHNNATPISLATPSVKKTLSTGKISFLNDNYNYTILHLAALFSIIGDEITPAIDTKNPAALIISTILSDLTQTEILSAITAQDMWQNTPLHYAAMAQSTNQALVINAFLSGLTINTSNATAINAQNKWSCTPVHYAATFAVNNHTLVNSLFTNLSTTQKKAALAIQDQWGTTALTYALLFKNSSFFKSAFWDGISKSDKISALISGKLGGSDASWWPIRYFQFFEEASLEFSHQVFTGMTKSDITSNFIAGIVLTPKFEFETIIAKTFIQDQL